MANISKINLKRRFILAENEIIVITKSADLGYILLLALLYVIKCIEIILISTRE